MFIKIVERSSLNNNVDLKYGLPLDGYIQANNNSKSVNNTHNFKDIIFINK